MGTTFPTATDGQGRVYHLITEADLLDPRRNRAGCPIHGSDHQRSLRFRLDGEHAGFGECWACGERVLVTDMNPEAAARLTGTAKANGGQPRPRRVTAESLLRPVRRRSAASNAAATDPGRREEAEALRALYDRMRVRLADERAVAYLDGRGISLDLARACGVGYIPADARLPAHHAKWRERLMFPLGSPAGVLGFIGRTLWGWQPGMDENEHKALLDRAPGAPRRWEKTNPAGWFGYEHLASASHAVLVEGAFDALALRAAGLDDVPVVALAGTACQVEWIPPSVRGVVLALDYDRAESRAAAERVRDALRDEGVRALPCEPRRDDGLGKDWSERWAKAQLEGVWDVFNRVDDLVHAAPPR